MHHLVIGALLRQALAPAVAARQQRRLQRARLQRRTEGVAHALQQGEAQAIGLRELLGWGLARWDLRDLVEF